MSINNNFFYRLTKSFSIISKYAFYLFFYSVELAFKQVPPNFITSIRLLRKHYSIPFLTVSLYLHVLSHEREISVIFF